MENMNSSFAKARYLGPEVSAGWISVQLPPEVIFSFLSNWEVN